MLNITLSCVNGSTAVNMTIAAGESVQTTVSISVGGVPVNLTGYTIKMQIQFGTPLLLTTGNNGITLPNAAGGVAQINISDSVSDAFTPGSYPYEFWTISSGGESLRLFTGSFTVLHSYTVIP